MDPASVVIGVVSGAAGLAALAISTTTYLIGLKDSYKHVELVVLDLVTTCQAFEIAWRRIHDWAEGHICQADADPIFGELLAYHENSKIVLGALHSELQQLEVNSKTTWRLSPKSKARTVLHEKNLKDHSDRLNRQINSLNLLLSAAQLPSPTIREVVLNILRPVFRKDEESAWTIVNERAPNSRVSTKARTSTWRPGSSILTGSARHSVAVSDNQPSDYKHFDFENDLILGPVYKRVLFAQLCTMPAISEASTKDLVLPNFQTDPGSHSGDVPDYGPNQPKVGYGPSVGATSKYGEDLSPEHISRILRACGRFSIGVAADLEELRGSEDGSKLPKRSLPLGSIIKQNELVPAGQAFVNAKLILGATLDDADQVAQALDEGAEINAVSEEGHTALKISLGESQTSTAAALILLYNETKVHLRDGTGDTLLHYAIETGNVSLIRRLVTSMDDLRVFGCKGATPLHVAAQGGVQRLTSLREINRTFSGQEVYPDMVLDQDGRSALHVAAKRGHADHAMELLRLGCDPSFIPKPAKRPQEAQAPSSPLYLAVAAGHVDLVGKILEECSEMLDLVNWKHHIRHSLLDCVRDSHLKQRYAMAELLISHGADWTQTWKQSDRLLEFANTGASPKLLLTLISQGCFPVQRDLDITPSLPALRDNNHRGLAATALSYLHSTNSRNIVGSQSRLNFYARLGNPGDGGRSVFTERLTLEEILLQILCGHAQQQAKDTVALTHDEHAKDALIPAKVALQAHPVDLGQAFYHIDRYMLHDTSQATNEARAKQHILSVFGYNKAPKALAPAWQRSSQPETRF